MVIISISQEYKSTEGWHDYKTGAETIYKEQEMPMDISKAKDNYNKNERPKCFNCNKYEHIVKEC